MTSLEGPIGRGTRSFVAFALFAALIAGLAIYVERSTETVSGSARIVDGDSLWVGGVEVRLYGIDAPELAQTCGRAGQSWDCGREAAEALRSIAAGRDVTCRPREQDRYGRAIAVCQAAGVDLGAAMIKGGLAIAYGSYEADQREARDARRGIWSSTFDTPATWRARHPRTDR
jgi:endonuclease YncB( thermonuclease family)